MPSSYPDVRAIRRQRLDVLIASCDKNQSRFAERLGVTKGAVSQWVSARGIGDIVARSIEKRLGLPMGWMDTLDPEPGSHAVDAAARTLPPDAVMLDAAVRGLPAEARGHVLDYLRFQLERAGQWSMAALIEAYRQRADGA